MDEEETFEDEDEWEEDEESEEWCAENVEIIRAKWSMDGAETLEEAAQLMENFAKQLRQLKTEGYILIDTIDDDYGFIIKKELLEEYKRRCGGE